MRNPQISIIIPFYNAEKYLRHSLQSIQNQTFAEWECLLINDGSTDSSDIICKEFACNDNRFKLFNNRNHGVSYSRNYGLSKAQGEWVFFLDADDWIESELIENYWKYTDNYDMVCGGFVEFGFSNNQFCVQHNILLDKKTRIIEYDSPQTPIKKLLIYCWGKLIRKSILSQNKIKFNEDLKLAEDFIFITHFLCYTQKVAFINYNGIHYRTMPSNNKYCMNGLQYNKHAKAMHEILEKSSIEIDPTFKLSYDYLELLVFSKFLSYLKSTKNLSMYKNEIANYNRHKVFDVASYYYKKGDLMRFFYYKMFFLFPSLSFKLINIR